MEEEVKKDNSPIKLSKYTTLLLESLKTVKPKTKPDDFSKIIVSQTVSFFAFLYEKIRNAVEFREDHQIRRAAIERILKRRLTINPEAKGEGENLLRELLWARYFDFEELGKADIDAVQKILDQWLFLKNHLIIGRPLAEQEYLYQFILDLITCEIEETLSPETSQKNAYFTFFIYQVLKNKIKLEGVNDEKKDAYFLAVLEKSFRRSDKSYQRYHLFITFYKPIAHFSTNELKNLSPKLPTIFQKIDSIINNPYVDSLARFSKKQLPPFIILFTLIKEKFNEIESILTNKEKLWTEVELICRRKYQELRTRIVNLAIRSFIYIFLTKMIFALILEWPLSSYFYGEINLQSILINTIFPPFLMLFIISFFKIPGEKNTINIYKRIVEIVNSDKSFETTIAYVRKKAKEKKPLLIFGFTIFYSLTFVITLSLIYEILTLMNFNVISQLIFIFFVSVVTFFSFRIKQIVNEFSLSEKESIFTPIIDFFFMPILSLGKFFSSEIAKLNFFIVIFDFIIEAPFKFLFEIIEEWIAFVRKRKEEII
ncbi:MAG: hypothetical protein N2482_02345 [Patescibacteria group bacterium]|nr:hypothetical protein [Patescibacteria group bacterium]